jgi:hypothetical protein
MFCFTQQLIMNVDSNFFFSLSFLCRTAFGRLSYTDAIEKLKEAVANGHKFDAIVEW